MGTLPVTSDHELLVEIHGTVKAFGAIVDNQTYMIRKMDSRQQAAEKLQAVHGEQIKTIKENCPKCRPQRKRISWFSDVGELFALIPVWGHYVIAGLATAYGIIFALIHGWRHR